MGGLFCGGMLRASMIVQHRPHEGRLLQDLIAGLIYITALFALITYVLNLPIRGLLATSGMISIALGAIVSQDRIWSTQRSPVSIRARGRHHPVMPDKTE
jgi:hypothetical protein